MINYNKQFEARMAKVVRNFNAKVKRLEREGMKYLPPTVSVKELKANYFERDSLKRKLKQLERFSTRGAEEIVELGNGAKATRWQINTLRSDMKYMKQYYSRKIDTYGNIIPSVLGQKQTVSYARMGDAKYENLKVLRKSLDKDINRLDQSDFNRFTKKVGGQMRRKEKQKYIFWANYFTFLEDVGYKAGIDEQLIERVKAKLSNVDIDDFMRLYEQEEGIMDLVGYYKIQKVRAGGFRKYKDEFGTEVDEVADIENIFKLIDLSIDDDNNVIFSEK